MIEPFEVEIVYQKPISKAIEREYYETFVKGQPGEELALLSADNEKAFLVTCIIRWRTASGTVLVGPGQTLEAACALRFAHLVEC